MKNNTILALIFFAVCHALAIDVSAAELTTTYNTFAASSSSPLSVKIYDELDLDEYGLSQHTLDYAVKGYERLVNTGVVNKSQYLTIVDYSQPIYNKRFYLLDVENLQLVHHTYVMHGRNTGNEMAESFSNLMNSHQSSLGFYLTRNTYTGQRGYSLRLEGLEKGFNSNALARGIVLHGSNYINEERVLQGRVERSLGCPAIPQAENAKVINLIKDGSVVFVYHPTETYLQQSSILNWEPAASMPEPQFLY